MQGLGKFILVLVLFSIQAITHLSAQILESSNRATVNYGKPWPAPAKGPLRISESNPNYFTDGSGKCIYLIGSHTWSNFQDMYFEGDKKFDYDQYMEFMSVHHFNFMRFWTWEHSAWATWTAEKLIVDPLPYMRSGPGLALDGKSKFDLNTFDQVYFDRMRTRIITARDHGIYASIMLFQAFSGVVLKFKGHDNNVFRGHYYNKGNNIQNLDGDKNNDFVLDIDDQKVREYQSAYIRKIIDTVWDLDNVLYEVINEGGSVEWDRFIIKTIQDYEKVKGKIHPVGLTGHGNEKLSDMLESPASWISPGSMDDLSMKGVRSNPPLATGKKVSVLDTDHIWGHGIDYHWVWFSFLRGHNVLFMDPWDPLPGWHSPAVNIPDLPAYVLGRNAMKNTALLANRLPLNELKPSTTISSSGFCLANLGKEYVVFVTSKTAMIDLNKIQGNFTVEWIHPTEEIITRGNDVRGGSSITLTSPFGEEGVAHLVLR